MEVLDISVFQSLHDQYNKLKSLQKNDKICKETEPAWCANEAKILLDTMIANLENLMTNVGKNHGTFYRLLSMKCTLMYEEAKFLVNIENEEQGQEIMSKTLDLLKDYFMKPEMTFLILRIVNHYSFLLLKQGEFSKPHKMLEDADQMYNELRAKNSSPIFYTADEIFTPGISISSKKDTPDKVDRLMTNNLLMLGFVHSKKGNHERYAYYNHQVLKRQLQSKECEASTWAMKAVKLASYFISKHRFREARHHLSAACHVLEENEAILKNSASSEADVQKWEELQLRFGDVAKCWVKYGLFLFGTSKSRLVSIFYGEPSQFLENLWLPPYDAYPPGISTKLQNSTQDDVNEMVPKTTEDEILILEGETECATSHSELKPEQGDNSNSENDRIQTTEQSQSLPEHDIEKTLEDSCVNYTKVTDSNQNQSTNENEGMGIENSDNVDHGGVEITEVTDECIETTTNSNQDLINENEGTENKTNEDTRKSPENNEDIIKCEEENIITDEKAVNKVNTGDTEGEKASNNETPGYESELPLAENDIQKQDIIEEIIPSGESKSQTTLNNALHILFTGLGSKDSGLPSSIKILESVPKIENDKDTQQNKTEEEDKKLLLFPTLNLSSRESQVTADLIETAEQARALFLFTHSWLKRSKMYYTLKDNPMEYVNAILDLSELYRYLAFYEEDIESQYSVQKRRADALETLSVVLREARPQCYMAVSIELLRELAEVQLEMMGLNLRRLYLAQEGNTSTHIHSPATDFTLHKMEAMADIHSRLEQFGESLGHRAELGDGLSEISSSEISGDSIPHYM